MIELASQILKKTSAGPDGFDKGCKWVLLEPITAAVEPKCQDPALLDPSSVKYGDENVVLNKVVKMNYGTKFVHR